MVVEYIKKAWDTYKKNATSFIVAKIVAAVIVSVIALIGLGVMFSSAGLLEMFELYTEGNIEQIGEIMQNPLGPLSAIVGLGGGLIFLLVAGVAAVFLKIGIFGMAAESLRGKTKVETMFKIAKQKGITALVASVLVGVVILILLMIMGGLSAALPLVGAIIGAIILIGIGILFSLVFPALVTDKIGALTSIQRSIKIARKNYFELLGLFIIYGIIILLISWIPIVGTLVTTLVIGPMLTISLVFFYRKKK